MNSTAITPQNIDQSLDAGRLEIKMRNGNWWTLRRNGATKRWKTDPERVYVGVKAGLRVYDAIATYDSDLPRGGHTFSSPYLRVKS
jgi:hypothetical protein